MRTVSTRFSAIAVAVCILTLIGVDAVSGGEVSVRLSNGESLAMKEPSDMMGLTWDKVKGDLPPIFLKTDSTGAKEDAISQLLVTAGSIGRLYVERYERLVGGEGDEVDLFKVEGNLDKIRRGGGNPGDIESVKEGDAVMFWSAMLEDEARELEAKIPDSSTPNSSRVFIDSYAEVASQGDVGGIYATTLRRVKRDKPQDWSEYLEKSSPEMRRFLETLAGSDNP
jgi:hypothetical protein